jgi:NAD(P)-dependent dehydrogenase (short-subunit alcohol dehydrogenase family)
MKLLRDLMNMSGRVGVVTGGAGHLGLALCEGLAELGSKVCVVDIVPDLAQKRAKYISDRFGVETSAIAADITSEIEVEHAVNEIISRHGRIDVLVNNAAYATNSLSPDGFSLEKQKFAQWQAQLAVILNGNFLISRACSPYLAAHSCGSVVNVASIYGIVGPDPALYDATSMINPAYYAAGKGGVVQFTRYLATMLAPHVRANCIAPGGIWRSQPDVFHERYKARTPLARMAVEEDFKGALAFLASDLSAYMTGQVMTIDGGWTAW